METPSESGLIRFFRELKRRRVVRVAIVYAVIGYGVVQVATNFFPALQLPGWTVTFVAALVLLGFPVALVLAWAFEITPDGVRRTEPSAPTRPAVASDRAVGFIGVGILIALVGFGLTYRAARDTEGDARTDAVRSIAVLPFRNLSTDAENEAFSDGLTEELLNVLAQIPGLRVPARTSSFAFKNVDHDITEIGQKLNVEVLLEGSVRKAGETLRITAQLINVADGSHLWSQQFDRQLADVFAIQQEIAEAIVQQLLPRFKRERGETEFVRQTTEDLEAYQLYLQGRHTFWGQGGEDRLRRAAAFFEAAIEKDTSYAIAWAGLSDAYMLLGGSGFVPPREIFPQSKAAALRALELDSRLAEGYVALASVNWLYDWDWPAADRNYRLSFSVNPLLHTRCVCYAWYLAVTGDLDAAVLEAERARSLDPLARLPRVIASWMYYLAGRKAEAQSELRDLFGMAPNDASARRISAWIAWDEGRRADAIAELEKVRAADDARGGFAARGSAVLVADLAIMYAGVGRGPEALQLLDALQRRARDGEYVPPEYIAAVQGAVGQMDAAFTSLDAAFQNRSNLAQFNVLPLSQPLRADPRYTDMLARVGIPSRAR